jgi:hypothetical protein
MSKAPVGTRQIGSFAQQVKAGSGIQRDSKTLKHFVILAAIAIEQGEYNSEREVINRCAINEHEMKPKPETIRR